MKTWLVRSLKLESRLLFAIYLYKNLIFRQKIDKLILLALKIELLILLALKDDYYEESTPDSGFFPESACDLYELNDYICYVGTFQKKTPAIGVDELNKMTTASLVDFVSQLEKRSQELSSSLVNELALFDELQYEKELKNTFITLISDIESKRRLILSDSILFGSLNKRQKYFSTNSLSVDETKFNLTTKIPFDHSVELNSQNLQTLNRLLQAINEDSHDVTELLTDYILKVVCPYSS